MSTTAKAELIGLVINKRWPIRRAMVIVIILLHALITINFAAEWSFVHSAFIEKREKCSGSKFEASTCGPSSLFGTGNRCLHKYHNHRLIYGACDSIMRIIHLSSLFGLKIWYCWIVWGRCWLLVLLPIIALIFGTSNVLILIYPLHMSNIQCSV